MKRFITAAALIALFVIPLYAQQGTMHDGGKMAMMGQKAMSFVYTADSLYSCPMHPMIVSDKPYAHCTIDGCGMPLKRMNDDQVKVLREAKQLYVCPMPSCSVVTASENLKNCPVCGMKLVPLQKSETSTKAGK